MFELSAALCLVAGAAIGWLKNYWIRAAVLVLIAVQVTSFLNWTGQQFQPKFDEKIASRAEIAQLAGMVRRTNGPILLDEYNGLLPLAGRRLYYQPFEFRQLVQAGLWDPAPLITDISQRKFMLLIIYFPRNFSTAQSPWPPNVYAKFFDAYASSNDLLAYNLIFRPKK